MTTASDPRCPHCGKPVIGAFVQGCEGSYHPACTQPDIQVQPWPWFGINPPWPFYVPPTFQVTC